MAVITAPALRRALIAGMRRVVSRREALNKINVFPVPDGDTGSNLAFTLGTVLYEPRSKKLHGAVALMRACTVARQLGLQCYLIDPSDLYPIISR